MIDKFTDSLEFEDVRALREMYTVWEDESSGKERGKEFRIIVPVWSRLWKNFRSRVNLREQNCILICYAISGRSEVE
jgi:hypothetical protein